MYSLTNKITVFLEFPSNITYLPNRLVGVPKLHYIEKKKQQYFIITELYAPGLPVNPELELLSV